jgi:osmoprotectant transport system permease protein
MPVTPADATPKPAALLLLCALVAVTLAGLPLVNVAPNRLLSGQGVSLWQAAAAAPGPATAALLSGGVLMLAVLLALLRPASHWRPAALLALGTGVLALAAVAGYNAADANAATAGLGRTRLGSGFWLTALWVWLAANELLRQEKASAAAVAAYWGGVLIAVLALLGSGQLDALSSLKEYANRDDDFWRALGQHLRIILITTSLTVAVGLPLGVAIHRRPRWAARVFPLLNLVQTTPSIALFALLMTGLALLGQWFALLPALGIHGVGLAPAVLALTLYSLLPLVRSTVAGLAQLPQAVVASAQAMGLSQQQQLWQIELPLALPVLLAGLKVMLVQTIGLTAVAALIGAGGLGTLMFEGLFSSAIDLVVLAIVPMVVLAWLAEALFVALDALSRRWVRR